MAEPKKRITSTRSGNRRSHLAIKNRSLSTCPKCQEKVLPHHICLTCGTYKGRQIIDLDKKDKKKKRK